MTDHPKASASPGLADLHRHLDGSLRPATLAELARTHRVPLPPDIRFTAGMGLDAALSRFATTLACLRTPEAVARVADEMCADAATDGVTTLEIRFAPQLHRGARIDRIVDAALDGIGARAGLILCVLYGEPPGLADELVDLARSRRGVVGLDLAGGPAGGHDWSMLDYASAFTRARQAGLGRTVHAGEGRPPAEIRVAIESLHAQRIGHGTTLLDDRRVLDLVLARDVVIEACPTSNVHTGIIADVGEHPLARWLDEGVAVCVNTDNTLLSDVSASEELDRVRAALGLDSTAVSTLIETGHRARFDRGPLLG